MSDDPDQQAPSSNNGIERAPQPVASGVVRSASPIAATLCS